MLLTDTEIQAASVIFNPNPKNFGSTSYDLSPDAIIESNGVVYKDEGYTVKPQEIVWVTSKEIVSLPKNITAHATIKTGLCNKGLLALNIGIVDPGWTGPLATAIINFSKSEYYLSPKATFLRLSFYKHEAPDTFNKLHRKRKEYEEEKKKDAIEIFGSTFLDFKRITKDVRDEFFGSYAPKVLFYITAIGFGIGGLSLFASLATYFMPGNGAAYQSNFTSVQQKVHDLDESTNLLSSNTQASFKAQKYEIKRLEDRLNQIEIQLKDLDNSN